MPDYHRPVPLADFTTQKDAVTLLQRSLERGRLGHAYLFTGQNLGQLENVGRALAQTLNCLTPPSPSVSGLATDSCGQCVGCRKITESNHPDMMVVKPESKLRQIKIGQIVRRPNSPPRVLHDLVYQKAVEGGYKVVLIVAADRLNVDAANALLKTLEEPPERTVFVLLSTEPERLLDTIRSRCLLLTFAGEGQCQFGEQELEWLQQFASMAARGEKDLFGRYRLLGTLLQQLDELNEAIMAGVEETSPLGQHEEIPAELREQWEEENKAASMAEYRYRRANFLVALQAWLRDVWLQASGLGNELAQFPDLTDSAQKVGRRLTPHEAEENLRLLEQTQRMLHTNVAELLALETGLLKLKL